MYRSIIVSLCAALLLGCAAGPLYQPASGGGFGYSDEQLAEDRYAITFKARKTDSQTAQNLALARAAQVTLAAGDDWFIVTENDVVAVENTRDEGEPFNLRAIGDCDSVLCGNTKTTRKYAGDGTNISDDARRDLIIRMQIRTGKGALPDPDYAYDAEETARELVPKN